MRCICFGFGVSSFRFQVPGLVPRVSGSGIGVQNFGFRGSCLLHALHMFQLRGIRGYLSHNKQPPPRNLQKHLSRASVSGSRGSCLLHALHMFRVRGFGFQVRFLVSSFEFLVSLGLKFSGFGVLACSMRCICSSSESSWSCEAFGGIKCSGFWGWNFEFRLSGSGIRDQVAQVTVTCQVVKKKIGRLNSLMLPSHRTSQSIRVYEPTRRFQINATPCLERMARSSQSSGRCSGFEHCRKPQMRDSRQTLKMQVLNCHFGFFFEANRYENLHEVGPPAPADLIPVSIRQFENNHLT